MKVAPFDPTWELEPLDQRELEQERERVLVGAVAEPAVDVTRLELDHAGWDEVRLVHAIVGRHGIAV